MIINIFIHIYYLTLPLGNYLSYFLKQKILVPSSVLTAAVRQSLAAKQWLTETRRFLLLNVRILVPSSALTAVVRHLLPAKQWLTETRRFIYYQFVM